MKVVEFEGTVTPNCHNAVPTEIAGNSGKPLHIVLRWDAAADEDGVWRTQGRQRFEAAYAPEDDVYDQLMDELQLGEVVLLRMEFPRVERYVPRPFFWTPEMTIL